MTQQIQRVELNKFYHISVCCPFCGIKVKNLDDPSNPKLDPCPHTLFIAHDVGFEFRSKRFNENLDITDDDEFWFPDGEDDDGIDSFTDKVTISDSVKIASYVGAPSGAGDYVGFAPLEDG